MDELSRYKTYKIGEAARLLGVKPYVLRFWESEFEQIEPIRKASGQRAYTEEHLRTIRRIQYLLHEKGLTIEGAKKQLTEDNRAGIMRDIERELLNMRDVLLGRVPLNALPDMPDMPDDTDASGYDEAEDFSDENIPDESLSEEGISDEAGGTYLSEDEDFDSDGQGPFLPGIHPVLASKPAPTEFVPNESAVVPSPEVEPSEDNMDDAEPFSCLESSSQAEPPFQADADADAEAEAHEAESDPEQPSETYRYSLSLIQPPD